MAFAYRRTRFARPCVADRLMPMERRWLNDGNLVVTARETHLICRRRQNSIRPCIKRWTRTAQVRPIPVNWTRCSAWRRVYMTVLGWHRDCDAVANEPNDKNRSCVSNRKRRPPAKIHLNLKTIITVRMCFPFCIRHRLSVFFSCCFSFLSCATKY